MAAKNARIKRKACVGKIQYTDPELARQAAINSSRTFKQRLGFYKCSFSLGRAHYHVGHTPHYVIGKINERKGRA